MGYMEDDGPMNDYEDQMDGVRLGLLDYDDVHCKHGTFVGNWAGPDYMCGYCEMGISDEEYEEGKQIAAEHEEKRKAARVQWTEFNRRVEASPTQEDKDDLWQEINEWLQSEEGKWLFR